MYDASSSATYQYDALDEPDPVFPEIDVTDYGRGDYVPFIDEVVEEKPAPESARKCGRCQQNKIDVEEPDVKNPGLNVT